jgi:hypothetical protein
MKIEELISGKEEHEKVEIEGITVLISTLKRLLDEGYVYFKPYKGNKTLSLWGKTCAACFTAEQLRGKFHDE